MLIVATTMRTTVAGEIVPTRGQEVACNRVPLGVHPVEGPTILVSLQAGTSNVA